MAWSRVLRCTVAIALALHVAAWQQDSWGWNLRNEDQAPKFAASGIMHLEGTSKADFFALSRGLIIESTIARMLYPAAATITTAVIAPDGDDCADRFCTLAVDVEILPLDADADNMEAFVAKASSVLNSREFFDRLESSDIHPSRSWQVQAVAKQRSMGASLSQQALQALKSLMPDAAAAAVLYGTESSIAADAATYKSPNLYESVDPTITTETASNSGEVAAGLGLELPGSSNVQPPSSAQFDIVAHNKDDEDNTYAADDDAVADYTYLGEEQRFGAPAASIGDASASPQLPPQLSEDLLDGSELVAQQYARLSGLSGPQDQAAGLSGLSVDGNSPTDVQIDGDLMVLSRLPVGLPLQQSIAQPVAALAADLARDVWQAVQQAENAAVQQVQQHNPFRVQEFEIIVEETSGSSSDSMHPVIEKPFSMVSFSAADEGFTSANSMDGSSSSSNDDSSLQPDMEISVTVESSRQRPFLPFLRHWYKKDSAAESSKQAAALVSAVINALGMSSGQPGAASAQGLQPKAEQQRMEPMLQQLRTTGAFEGRFNTNDQQSLSETTAAAVAAAATAMNEDPWDAMEMEVEVTHTTQKMPLTWYHVLLLAGAMVITHVGLFLLVAPFYARYMERDGEEEEGDGGEVKQQFISAGLAEAGLYTKLLAEAA